MSCSRCWNFPFLLPVQPWSTSEIHWIVAVNVHFWENVSLAPCSDPQVLAGGDGKRESGLKIKEEEWMETSSFQGCGKIGNYRITEWFGCSRSTPLAGTPLAIPGCSQSQFLDSIFKFLIEMLFLVCDQILFILPMCSLFPEDNFSSLFKNIVFPN